MKTFADVAGDKNNHFNLIRMFAAAAVLVGHNAVFRGVDLPYESFLISYRVGTGGISVDIFFVISGFLVTASLFNRGSVIAFLSARFLRIFPALWVMLLVVVFGIGLSLTTLPAGEYLASSLTWRFLWRWGTIVNGFANFLPGLFENNPFDHKVNGSLWTVTVEWRLYMILAASWFALALVPAWRRTAFRIGIPIVALAIYLQVALPEVANLGAQHSFCFFAGSSIYLFGDRIPVGPRPLLATLAVFALGLASKQAFFYIYVALLPYLVLNLAYMPGRWLLRYNDLGDYSYGLYIYAFPISQAVIALRPDIGLTGLTLWSTPLTLVPAILSWRWIEKPALARKEALAAFLSRGAKSVLARLSPVSGDAPSPFPARPWRKPDAPAPQAAERQEPAL